MMRLNLFQRSGDGGSKENIAPPAPSSGGGGGGPAVAVAQDRKMPPQPPPPPCIPYTVQNNENLMSLAARFDTTPSELTQLNRLKSRMIFPGQVLAVPDRSGNKEMGDGNADTNKTQDALSSIRPPLSSGFSGDALRPPPSPHRLPRTPANSVDVERSLDRDCLEKFLKITVRHITDGQGVVAGVLLVTPNAVMFDPNVSDPLVIEHGPESYGVIAPMEYVVNSALYYDIAIMRVKDTNLPRPEIPKPEIYWGPVPITQESPSPAKDASLSKDTTFPELTTTASQDDNDSSCSCGGDTRESSAFPKAFEHELLTPGGDISPLNAEVETGQKSPSSATDQAHQSQPSQAVVVGDLTPIAEATQRQESTHAAALLLTPNVAQTQSDNINVQDFAQTDTQQDCNDKKRTTSVTFDLSQEDHGLTESSADDLSQETRKQKVLKRLSYPLSWMDGFNSSDKENMPGQQPGPGVVGAPPASTHPVGSTERVSEGVNMSSTGSLDSSEPKQTGVFSNVISGVSSGVSGVTNMLSRRTSLDFARRPSGSQGPPSQQQPQITTATTTNTATVTIQQLPASQQFAQPQHKRAQYKDGPKFGLKSMVSMDDMPELFASFDKLIPKPSSANDESPLYLCLRMGKPANRKIPKSTPIMSYGKKKMRPEYWFSIPKSRSDELYHFFQLWAQDIYGELNEEDITRRGFLLLEEETDVWDDDASESGESGEGRIAGEITEMTKEMTKESWEVASMSEELRRALYSSNSLTSLDLEVFLPDILGETEIITDHVRKSMYKKLPARAQGYSWKLVFSTAQHGFSLNSLYRKNSDVDSAMMIFIQDTHQNVFGAVLSCSLHVSELFYGTGECFLFRFHPEFEAFPWTGENTFFVKGNNESLIIGGGDGRFGVWLDGDLYQGRTQSCKTFDNPPMTDSEDFVIKTVECWAFE